MNVKSSKESHFTLLVYYDFKESHMKAPHPVILLALLAPAGFLPLNAQSMPMGMNMDSKPAESSKTASAKVHRGTGTVNRIDMNTGKIKITHSPIPSLGWSAMTMDFQTKDKTQLSKLKAGQKVNFDLIKGSDGQYMITRISLARS